MITTGEGGMITTNDEKLYQIALSLRHHGIKMGTNVHDRLGYNWRMPEITAILGLSQLNQLENFIAIRTELARSSTDQTDTASERCSSLLLEISGHFRKWSR